MTTIGGVPPLGVRERLRTGLQFARWADRSRYREVLAPTIDLADFHPDDGVYLECSMMTSSAVMNFPDDGGESSKNSDVRLEERRLYNLGEGLVHSHTGIALHESAIILQSGPPLRDLQAVAAMSGACTAIAAVRSGRHEAIEVGGPVFPLGREPIPNYYHWIVDILPRVLHAARRYPDLTVIGSKVPQFATAMLDLLGIPILVTSRVVKSPQVVVADHTYPTVHPEDVAILREAGRRITGRIALTPAVGVFVTRSGSSRATHGSDSVDRRAQELGLEVMNPSNYPDYLSQVAAFRGATAIVGPHGAGLVNMVFADPGAEIIEISVDPGPLPMDRRSSILQFWGNPLFRHLAATSGHHYQREVILPTEHAPYGSSEDIVAVLERRFTA